MSDNRLGGFTLTDEEISFLRELTKRGSRFMLVGMVSAILQGADAGTRDLDLWFATTSDGSLDEAARSVGGIFMWRANPPSLGGSALARVDVVNHMSGLGEFADECDGSLEVQIDDFIVKILPIERIIASKKAADRPKDRAALPALRAALAAIKYRGKSRP